ncbi:MAG: hypothetical protein JSV88_19745 [Candidatus Aminicenantes bacterium]|nr:MAG: hypothetical protein JSV88_19745 [Candidatus Aminicenantes bacterium]
MSFYILYIEDESKDWINLEKAVKSYNKKKPPPTEQIYIERVENPEELEKKMNHRIDIILADMLFWDSKAEREENRLLEIVKKVKDWVKKNDAGRPIPIIAYTIQGEEALQLEAKEDLYDIWDKKTAPPEYVTWRLSNLSRELSRIRPDALIQTKIRTDINLSDCVSWHMHVLDMIRRYDEGWTERDQIERAGNSIQTIAQKLNSWEDCQPMWDVVTKWELFGRAVSRRARGHARHVINVFWLGYYLLHHKHLRDFFVNKWKVLKDERSKMAPISKENSFEAINNVWFYTGIFHDIAGCLEKYSETNNIREEIYSTFDKLELKIPQIKYFAKDDICKQGDALLHEFEGPLQTQLKAAWEESLKEEKADHGMLAALNLRKNIMDRRQACYAREAARAISIHNLIGRFKEVIIENLTWEEEPFACLLLLCDQIQTWDRERGDRKLSDKDEPERAELSELDIELRDSELNEKRLHIKISIDYISPEHLKYAPEIYERVKDDLNFILRDKPRRALNKIAKPWPFSFEVKFSLNKDPLEADITID